MGPTLKNLDPANRVAGAWALVALAGLLACVVLGAYHSWTHPVMVLPTVQALR